MRGTGRSREGGQTKRQRNLLWPKWLWYIGTRLGEGSRSPDPRRFGVGGGVRRAGKGPQVLSEICHKRDLAGDTCIFCGLEYPSEPLQVFTCLQSQDGQCDE